ncbi:MAG: GbsR/MarR family transcriptional regulator [Candidatus Nanohaloarchaea archaeon]
MAENNQDPEEKVIRAMEESAEVYGMRKSYARVYGTLYFSPGDQTMDQIAEETGYSKSTVSEALNKLEDVHFVHSRKKEGEGKTRFYTAEENFEKAFKEFLDDQVSREMDIMMDAIEDAREEAIEGSRTERKIENLEKMYRRSEKIVTLLKKIPTGSNFSGLLEPLKKAIGKGD